MSSKSAPAKDDLAKDDLASEEGFLKFLKQKELKAEVIEKFENHPIIKTDRSLTLLDHSRLKEIFGLENLSDQLTVCHHIGDFLQKKYKNKKLISPQKLFNDPVHGNVELHELAVLVVDTPQFQRLRHIKQLAGLCYVYPGGTHTRFEHSIGTYHLAGQLVSLLRERQPELNISPMDVLCVQLAGLCHDLGHGPFSHLFDHQVIPGIRERMPEGEEKKRLISWKHEDASIKMFDYLIEQDKIREVFLKWGFADKDFCFVKGLIRGKELGNSGRDDKVFLYEVVANEKNGIDVDKWDYMARDCHHLGIKTSFDHKRFMHHMRVIKVGDQLQICMRDKEIETVYDMFLTRYNLHRQAYQHPVGKAVELMIGEALILANDDLKKIRGEKLSECVHDMEAYTSLTDYIYYQILMSKPNEQTEQNLFTAKNILKDIERRKFWKCVGTSLNQSHELGTDPKREKKAEVIKEEIIQEINTKEKKSTSDDDVVVRLVKMDFGMKTKNPVKHMRFYTKSNPDKAIEMDQTQISRILPQTFQDEVVTVYSKKANTADTIRDAFAIWCKKNGYSEPRRVDKSPLIEKRPVEDSSSGPTEKHAKGD